MASPSQDKLLGRELGRIEHQYLRGQWTVDQEKRRALVQDIMEKFILKELRGTFCDVAYTGSNYELSAIPDSSDYDIQLYLNLRGQLVVEDCDDPAWKKVSGGPSDLIDSNGYLSTGKARTLIQSKIDRALQGHSTYFQGERVNMTRSMHGPATTLNVSWRTVSLSIDIVVCLKANNLSHRMYREFNSDLVGKPYGLGHVELWRISYSSQEVEKLRRYHLSAERKLTLLRIMKVMKLHHSQLAHFPSYFYKNLLFKLDGDNPYASWSAGPDLSKRFKDMIQAMYQCLRAESLPLHFNRNVNYLQGESRAQLRETANYLQRIIDNDRYIDLASVVPNTHQAVSESVLQSYSENF